jgi:GLPGLI family protein
MKKLISTLALATIIPLAAYAQQQMTQGTITYDVTLQLRKQVAKKNPALAPLVPEIMHTTLELPFRNEAFAIVAKPGKSSKGSVQIQSGGRNEKHFVNLKTGTGRTECIVNGRSYYCEESGIPAATISYQEGKKQITGYNCNKAVVTTADKKRYTVWYSTTIPSAYSPEGLGFAGLKGAVLEYGNDEMICTAISVKAAGFTVAAITHDSKARKVTPEQMQDLQEDAAATKTENAGSPEKNGQRETTKTVEIKL